MLGIDEADALLDGKRLRRERMVRLVTSLAGSLVD